MNNLIKIALSALLLASLASTAQARDSNHSGPRHSTGSSQHDDNYGYDQDQEYRERLLGQHREHTDRGHDSHHNGRRHNAYYHNNWQDNDYYQQRRWYDDKEYPRHSRHSHRDQRNSYWDD